MSPEHRKAETETSAPTEQPAAGADAADAAPPTEPAEIQRDIEQTRAQLADTIDALASKVNVSARTKEKAHETAETVQAKTEQLTGQAKDATDQALAKLPPPAREKVEHAATTARRNPVPAVAGAVALLLVLRRLFRHRK